MEETGNLSASNHQINDSDPLIAATRHYATICNIPLQIRPGIHTGNNMATQNRRIDQQLDRQAAATAKVETRTAPQQVEHWAKIGKMVVDNPDLSYAFIKSIFDAQAEIEVAGGMEALEPYEFG